MQKSPSLPIIFIHKGNQRYLHVTLCQAKSTNPYSKIILLGDEHNKQSPADERHNLSAFSIASERIAKVYQHLAQNPYQYELFCLARRFILLEFMKQEQLDQCFYTDSDILLYSDVSEQHKRRNKYDLAYTSISGHSIFVNSRRGLEKFCKFIENQYIYHFSKLQAVYTFLRIIGASGGISDMWMFTKYRGEYPELIGNIQEADAPVFDGFIGTPDGYDTRFGMKKIIFKYGHPFAVKKGKEIAFNSLHLQGYFKYFVEDFFSQKLGYGFHMKLRMLQYVITPYIMPFLTKYKNLFNICKKRIEKWFL